jgi:hypothetical protein
MTDLPLLQPSTGNEPAAGDPAADAGATRRPRNRRILIGILAGIVVVLAVVIGVVWHFVDQQSVSLTLPDKAAGLTIDNSDDAKQTAEYLRTAIAAKANLDNSVGGVYRDPASRDHDVMLFGGTRLLLNPSKDLDQAFTLLDEGSGSVTKLHEVPAGPLGGVMKCGTTTTEGTNTGTSQTENGTMPVCGWADRDSLALALFPGRSVEQAADLLRTLRSAVEHTG